MSRAHVLHFAEIPEVDWGKGVTATPLVSQAVDSQHMTSGITSFAPGSALPLHTHNCDEVVCVVEGVGTAEVDGVFTELRPFDTTFVPQGIQHRFHNRGQTLMRIFWSYPSGHVTRTLVESGVTIDDLTPPV